MVPSIKIIFNQPNSKLFLCQHGKVVKALTKFRINDCKPVNTLMITGLSLDKLEFTDDKVKYFPFHLAIGTLHYILQYTRPDILFVITYLSCFSNAYNLTHVQALSHVFY